MYFDTKNASILYSNIYISSFLPEKFKKILLLRCIHHFKSGLINIMDHMRISGTKPSSVILSQTMKRDAKKKAFLPTIACPGVNVHVIKPLSAGLKMAYSRFKS